MSTQREKVAAVKATTTQVQNGWRATLRTGVAVVVGLAALTPVVLGAVADGDPERLGPGAVLALSIAGAVTRVMSLPQVEAFIARFLPWLAADKTTTGKG